MTSLKVIKEEDEPWYKNGLKFSCTGCGACCTGAPGYVWLKDSDIKNISAHLNISIEEFVKTYTRLVNGRLSLKELPPSNDCIFLEGKFCKIYPVRPVQCQTFPWWPQNLTDKDTWNALAKECEGISKCADTVPLKKIQEELDRYGSDT